MRAPERERHGAARCGSNAAVPLTPTEKENMMQCLYRCTRCGTGWLATMVEHGDGGVAVHVFLCSHCRYASQPGVPVAVQEGASALPIRVRAALVPVARLTGPGIEALRLEELLRLLGLLPDAPGSAAQRPALARAGIAAGVSPVTPADEGGEDRQGGNARGKAAGEYDQRWTVVVGLGRERQASQMSPHPRRWGNLAKWRHQGAENHYTTEYRVVQESTMPTHRHGIVPGRVWHIMRSLLAHGRAMLRTWQQRRAERHDLCCLLRWDDRLLADIGLNRCAVAREARRPFWHPLAPALAHGSVHHARQRPNDPWQTVGFLRGL